MRRITGPATRGASTRCTTTRTRCPTRIERITHSICTLEFEDHRPLYDWLVDHLIEGDKPHQYRVRAAEPELHRDEQAQAAAARAAAARLGLGRSANADDQRPAPPRLHARIDPRLLRAHRRREEGKRHRRRAARAQRARGSQSPRAARDDRAAAAEGGVDELPGGRGRRGRRHQQSRRRRRRHAQGAVFARAVHRARRLHGAAAEEVLPAVAGEGSASAVRVLHHLHRGRQRRTRGGAGAALHLRSGHAGAATRPTAGA